MNEFSFKKYIPLSIPLIAALLLIRLVFASDFEDVLESAYLQALTPNRVVVMVESKKQNDNIIVKYESISDTNSKQMTASSKFSKETTAKPTTYVHRIVLENLTPNTEYEYEVFVDGKSHSKAKFRSGVEAGTPFRFASMGDCRSNPKTHSKIAKMIHEEKPLFSLYSGDLCYNDEYKKFRTEFFTKAELKLDAEVPFFNAVGNHEDWDINTQAFTQSIESNSEQSSYYSFDIGDVHFLIISTENGITRDSKQWKFFKADLAKNKKEWVIAVSHIPAYCAGGHGENNRMKRLSREVLEPGGLDIFLTGHSHFYQRNLVNGVQHIICAGGGAPLYTPKKKKYVQKSKKIHHFAYFDVSPDTINMTVIDIDGNVIDTLELTK
jgi:predicted phosphodiesterase